MYSENNIENKFGEGVDIEAPSSNNLALSIISLVLGFFSRGAFAVPLILGVIALVYSLQVNSKIRVNDMMGAKNCAQVAKILAIISIVISCLFLLAVGLFFGLLCLAFIK